MKIIRAGADLFHANGETKLIFTFRCFAKAPTDCSNTEYTYKCLNCRAVLQLNYSSEHSLSSGVVSMFMIVIYSLMGSRWCLGVTGDTEVRLFLCIYFTKFVHTVLKYLWWSL